MADQQPTTAICADCGDDVHAPGRCERDNCGQPEIILPGARIIRMESNRSVHMYTFDTGHRVPARRGCV